MAPAADEPQHGVRPDRHLAAASPGDLLRRVAEGDPEAFEILYLRYARPVYGLALRLLRNHERAEAATRRTFAAVRRTAASDVPEGAGDRWLYTVARNAIDAQARRAAVAEEGWSAFCVQAAVAELPEQERLPLELAYWGGRTRDEIAELLGLPLGTVETRTRSALARLAVRLEGLP